MADSAFKCPNCDYASKQKNNVNRHVRAKHDNQGCPIDLREHSKAELTKWKKRCYGGEEEERAQNG